jgi:hypothetical protein
MMVLSRATQNTGYVRTVTLACVLAVHRCRVGGLTDETQGYDDTDQLWTLEEFDFLILDPVRTRSSRLDMAMSMAGFRGSHGWSFFEGRAMRWSRETFRGSERFFLHGR